MLFLYFCQNESIFALKREYMKGHEKTRYHQLKFIILNGMT